MIQWNKFNSDLKNQIDNRQSDNESEFSENLTKIIDSNVLSKAEDQWGNKLIYGSTGIIQSTIYGGLLASKRIGDPSAFIKSITKGMMLFMAGTKVGFTMAPPGGTGTINKIIFPGIVIDKNIVNVNDSRIFCNIVEIILKSFMGLIRGSLTYVNSSGTTLLINWSGLK